MQSGRVPVLLTTVAILVKSMNDDDVIGFEALWDSMMKCKRGVIWKDGVAHFVLNGVPEVVKLSEELRNGSYIERKHKYFTIRYPKERQIMSIAFRDRVYQRSLNDVAIYPAMSKSFIYDNAACQKGKGADFARERMKCHIQRYFRKHGANGYILKIDIRKYYDSMRHDVVKACFAKKLPENIYLRAERILDGFPGDKGFNPGSQIIQIAGISVLDGIDHFVKERLRVRHYMRYMDDMVLISDSREELQAWLTEIKARLAEIGFEAHPTKTKITALNDGVMWLGYRYRLTESGKVVMTLDPDRVNAARRKYYRLVKQAKQGKITKEKVDQSFQCWRNHASKGDGRRMLRNMDRFYRGLWKEGLDAQNCETICASGDGGTGQSVASGKRDAQASS